MERADLMDRINKYAVSYTETWKKPIPLVFINRRFGRIVSRYFKEIGVLGLVEADERFAVRLSEKGATEVLPLEADI